MSPELSITLERLHSSEFPNIIASVEIPPSSSTSNGPVRVVCGLYENGMAEPRFHLDVHPKPDYSDSFVAMLERIDQGDHYELVYFFDNYGGPTYHVTIRTSDHVEIMDDGCRV